MVKEPNEQFSQIFAFIGENFDEGCLDRPASSLPLGDDSLEHYKNIYSSISPKSIGQGRLFLSKKQLLAIDEYVNHFQRIKRR